MDTTRTRRMRASAILGLAGAALLIFATHALADGATALTFVGWSKAAHLLFGNALIGLAEGVLVALIFRCRLRRAVPIMILANYASAWLGFIILSAFGEQPMARLLGDEPLYAVPVVVRWIVLAAFIETLLVEWPFCLWAVTPGKHRFSRSVGACLVAQLASYAVLIPYYQHSSLASLYTDLTVDRATVSEAPRTAVVYFMSVKEDAVYRIDLNGTDRARVCPLGLPKAWQTLFFRAAEAGSGRDLCLGMVGEPAETGVVLQENLPLRTAGWRYRGEHPEEHRPYGGWPDICDLRTDTNPRWTPVAAKGELYVRDNQTQQLARLGLATLFVAWEATHPTILPGDLVVCQFSDQILLIDLKRRRVGLLAMGHSPVVGIIEHAPTSQATGSAPSTSSAAAP